MHKLTAIITRYGKRKLEVTDPEAVTTIVSVSELYKHKTTLCIYTEPKYMRGNL